MFKNIILAVIIVAALTYGLGHIATDWFGMHLVLTDYDLDASSSLLAVVVAVAVMVIVGFIIAFSIVAAVGFAVIAALIGIVVVGLSVFWPFILVLCCILWLVRDKKTPAY
ncbi:hypothetical protein [Paraglaciecola aestuariivivens]